jgi:hypothetical protein
MISSAVLLVEVGALSVGRIVQVHKRADPFKRGEEKSIFKFGGSAVVLFGKRGAWLPAPDIFAKTREVVETFIRLGDVIATGLKDTPAPTWDFIGKFCRSFSMPAQGSFLSFATRRSPPAARKSKQARPAGPGGLKFFHAGTARDLQRHPDGHGATPQTRMPLGAHCLASDFMTIPARF